MERNALDFGLGGDADFHKARCKQWEMIGAGIPVVTEDIHGCEPVLETGHGFVVNRGSLCDYASCILEAAKISWERRHAVRAYMRKAHGWDVRAQQLATLFVEEPGITVGGSAFDP